MNHVTIASFVRAARTLAQSLALGLALCASSAWATPPTVSLTSPANNSVWAEPGTFTVSAAASDSDGTISSVYFLYDGSGFGGYGTLDANGKYSIFWNNIPAGTHTIRAVAADNSNETATSAPVTIVVNPNVLPVVSMSSPANNSVWVVPGTFTVSATATDSDGTISSVYFLYDGSGFGGYGTLDANGKYSIFWNNIPVGTHNIRAVATDNAGGTTTSAPITIVVNVSAAPTVSVTAPSPAQAFGPVPSIVLTASAADSDGTVTGVQFYNGATLLGSGSLTSGSAASGTYSYTLSNPAVGSYSITAVAADNTSVVTTSSPVAFTVNPNSLPTISITSPAGTAVFAAPAEIPLAANAVDSDGTIAQVQFFNGGTLIGTGVSNGVGGYSVAWTGVASGSYTVTAVAIDNLGGTTTSAAVNITVGAATASGLTGMFAINADHLGTPRLIEDQSQQAVWRWDQQEPFGDSVPNQTPGSGGAFVFNLRFPGQYADQETGLNYNYFRDYSPADGRYTQSDPIGLRGGLNIYGYANGNSLLFVDVQGLEPLTYEQMAKIVGANNSTGVSNELIICVAWNESNFDPNAGPQNAGKGLLGITQTATNQVNKKANPAFNYKNIFDPGTNIQIGSNYLAWALARIPSDPPTALQKWYGTGSSYPAAKIFECEKCLKEVNVGSCKNSTTCLRKIHK